MATSREKVEEILSRDVSAREIHAVLTSHTHEAQNEIRTREALLWLADRVDALQQEKKDLTLGEWLATNPHII